MGGWKRGAGTVVLVLVMMGAPAVLASFPALPIVAQDGFSGTPTAFDVNDGIAAVIMDRTAYLYELADATGSRTTLLSWARQVAVSREFAVVSKLDPQGFQVYKSRPDVSAESPLPETRLLTTWQRQWWVPYSGPGLFGHWMEVSGGQVFASVRSYTYPPTPDKLLVYDLESAGPASQVQTIALPGRISWSDAQSPFHVHEEDMVIAGLGAIWHYQRSGNQWSLVDTIPGTAGKFAQAVIADDDNGERLVAYTTDRHRVYVAPLDNPVQNRVRIPVWGDPTTTISLDDGVLTVTEDTFIYADVFIFGKRDGVWQETYYPQYTSIGRWYTYQRAGVADGHIVIQGVDYGSFEPNHWVDFYVVPEVVDAVADDIVPVDLPPSASLLDPIPWCTPLPSCLL